MRRSNSNQIYYFFIFLFFLGAVATVDAQRPGGDNPFGGGKEDFCTIFPELCGSLCELIPDPRLCSNVPRQCRDGIQNGDETGVDCGGSCRPCVEGIHCGNGIKDGDETGVDCGGSCEPCLIDSRHCSNGIQDADETGVDCGGADCEPCIIFGACNNGIQDGLETGVDCGGFCPPCEEEEECEIKHRGISINHIEDCTYSLVFNFVSSENCGDLTYVWNINGLNRPSENTPDGLIPITFEPGSTNTITLTLTSSTTGETIVINRTFVADDCEESTCEVTITEFIGQYSNIGSNNCPFSIWPTIVSNGCSPECNTSFDYEHAWTINGGSPSSGLGISINTSGTFNVCLTLTGKEDCPGATDSHCEVFNVRCKNPLTGNGDNEAITTANYNSFAIYPNPVQDVFTLNYELPSVENTATMTLVNMQGQEVMRKPLIGGNTQEQIAVNALPKGIYFATIRMDGAVLYQSKVVLTK